MCKIMEAFFLKIVRESIIKVSGFKQGKGIWRKVVFLSFRRKIEKFAIFGRFGRSGRFVYKGLIVRS